MSLKYRPEIDGLRTLAIVPVILFHCHIEAFSGGFTGVDIFFVISGYLICSILRRDMDSQNFSLAQFYVRRARRILPALTVVVLATTVVGVFVLLPMDLQRLGYAAMSAASFLSNLFFWRTTDYFGPKSSLNPLLHTWSLSVEEQFYLFVPILLWFAARATPTFTKLCIIAVSAVSFVLCLVLTTQSQATAFYSLPTRAWELGAGAMLAYEVFCPPAGKLLSELAGSLGLALICAGFFLLGPDSMFPGYNALLPVVGASLIILGASDSRTLVGKMLRTPAFTFIGKGSYSLYLWHWPIIVFLEYYVVSPIGYTQAIAAIALTGLISTVSYFYVERPFRRPNARISSRFTLILSSFTLAFLAGIGLLASLNGGWRDRFTPDVNQLADGAVDYNLERKACHGAGDGKGGPTPEDASIGHLCKIGASDKPATFILWGDSHAEALRAGVDAAAKKLGVTGYIATYSSCPPLDGLKADENVLHRCHDFNASVMQFIQNSSTISTVVWGGYWEKVVGTEKDVLPGGRTYEAFAQGLKDLVIAQKRVVVVDQIPEPGVEVPSASARNLAFSRHLKFGVDRETYDQQYAKIRSLWESLSLEFTFSLVHPQDVLCYPIHCDVLRNGRAVYSDEDHLTRFGSRELEGLFLPALATP